MNSKNLSLNSHLLKLFHYVMIYVIICCQITLMTLDWPLWSLHCIIISINCNSQGGGGGGERRDLGPRNDVLTTCKAVTLRGGQRIIPVFFPQLIFDRSEKRTGRGNDWKIEKIISCIFVFLANRNCLLVLKLRGKLNLNRVRY